MNCVPKPYVCNKMTVRSGFFPAFTKKLKAEKLKLKENGSKTQDIGNFKVNLRHICTF